MIEKIASHKVGFTIVEVSLFLAISGVIMVGIIATTSGTINRHRYDDAVQDFASFLMGLYGSATNVQNVDSACSNSPDAKNTCGQSGEAVYGYIAIFGKDAGDNKSTVYTYNLKGKAEYKLDSDKRTFWNVLDKEGVSLDVALNSKSTNNLAVIYNPLWESRINNTSKDFYQGAVAIIRSPLDGTLYTAVYEGEGIVNSLLSGSETQRHDALMSGRDSGSLSKPANFCIWSEDQPYSRSRNVRIHAAGHTASAVEIIAQDGEDNQCH